VSRLKDWFFSKPHTPPYVFEDMEKVHPRRLLRAFGIDWMASPNAWIAPVWMLAVGIVTGLVVESHAPAGKRLLLGLAYGALILASIFLHYLGGAVAGRLVDAPMRQVVSRQRSRTTRTMSPGIIRAAFNSFGVWVSRHRI